LWVRGNARLPDIGYMFLSALDEDSVVGEDTDAESTPMSLGTDSETLTQNPLDPLEEPPTGQSQERVNLIQKLKVRGS
jgi:hypothetical protein